MDVTTDGTGTTDFRVHQKCRDGRPLGFVGHAGMKLKERQIMQDCPLRVMNRSSLPNALEIFRGNRSICGYPFAHRSLADVVYVSFCDRVRTWLPPLQSPAGPAEAKAQSVPAPS